MRLTIHSNIASEFHYSMQHPRFADEDIEEVLGIWQERVDLHSNATKPIDVWEGVQEVGMEH